MFLTFYLQFIFFLIGFLILSKKIKLFQKERNGRIFPKEPRAKKKYEKKITRSEYTTAILRFVGNCDYSLSSDIFLTYKNFGKYYFF